MEESKRLITSWVRVKHWLSENFPETLENLYSPAFDSQIAAAESTIGLRFPDGLKALLLEHNGEDHHWPPGIFPNGHRFLPTEDIVETWFKLKEYNDTTPEKWLPFSQSRAKSIRFLDFNPPQGGTPGQVVEVDFNLQTYDVLAYSFVEYIEKYAMELAVNKYAVIGDDILPSNGLLNIDDLPEDDTLESELLDFAFLETNSENDFENNSDYGYFDNESLQDNTLQNRFIEIEDDFVESQSDDNSMEDEFLANEAEDDSMFDEDLVDIPLLEDAVALAPAPVEKPRAKRQTKVQPKVETPIKEEVQNKRLNDAPQPAQCTTPSHTETKELHSAPAPATAKQTVSATTKSKAKPKTAVKAQAKRVAKPAAKTPPASVPPARKEVAPAQSQTVAAKPAPDRLESGERLIIIGEMTSLMGKEEMLFTVETEQAKEYTFLAKASFTKGFSDIAIDQYVRVLAKKFHGEIKSHFIDQGLAKQPEYVAFDYVVLPVEKPSANKVSLPPPENLDQIAHSILQSIQASIKRGINYQEVKPEQSAQFHSKFYTDNTEKLLKLGFHYTADLADQTAGKSAQNTPPYFRVMSFFDDGIVASYYHIKPKFSWPFHAARKVIEFETELSDGNIIISTTVEDEIEYPLPKTISRYVHPPSIPIEGLLHKHRSKIRRYQTHKPDAAIVKVRSKKEFVALRQRRQQLIYNHLKSIGWVTKEYVAKQFNNKEVAEQVYARIKQFAGTKI